jgi:hypothetical protein
MSLPVNTQGLVVVSAFCMQDMRYVPFIMQLKILHYINDNRITFTYKIFRHIKGKDNCNNNEEANKHAIGSESNTVS